MWSIGRICTDPKDNHQEGLKAKEGDAGDAGDAEQRDAGWKYVFSGDGEVEITEKEG